MRAISLPKVLFPQRFPHLHICKAYAAASFYWTRDYTHREFDLLGLFSDAAMCGSGLQFWGETEKPGLLSTRGLRHNGCRVGVRGCSCAALSPQSLPATMANFPHLGVSIHSMAGSWSLVNPSFCWAQVLSCRAKVMSLHLGSLETGTHQLSSKSVFRKKRELLWP